MEKNENTRVIKESYNLKYPTRIQIKYFAKRYSTLTKDVKEYFIKNYFKHMNITDKDIQLVIRNNVLNRFP